jgi:4-amino-4-deoxy-L-arabinose transferase-like glycosyltransferase
LVIYSFLMTLSSDILSTWPNYLNLALLISAAMSNSWYSAVSSMSWSSRFHFHTLVHFPQHFPLPCSKTSFGIGCETPGFRTIRNHWSNFCSVHLFLATALDFESFIRE